MHSNDIETPAPKKLISQIQASSKRYNSYNAETHINAFRPRKDTNEPELVYSKKVVWRSTSDKSFCKIDSIDYEQIEQSAPPTKTTTTYLTTPQYSKKLVESDNTKPRGEVAPPNQLENNHCLTMPRDAMWDFCTWPLDKADTNASSVSFDSKTNTYILKLKMGSTNNSPFIKLYVDPSKGYLPTRKQLLKHDSTLVMDFKNHDFKQLKDSLWVPLKYTWLDPRDNFKTIYEVKKIAINETIPDNLFELTFPKGTIVTNNIANKKYIEQ